MDFGFTSVLLILFGFLESVFVFLVVLEATKPPKKKLMEKCVVLQKASFFLSCFVFLAFVEGVFGCFGFRSQHEQKKNFLSSRSSKRKLR